MRLKKPKKTVLVIALLMVAVAAVLYHRFRYPAYELIDLGSLGGANGEATAVNNLGQVVGWSETADGREHAFIWDANDGIRRLGTRSGSKSYAWDINDKGQVVGSDYTANGGAMAFLWEKQTGMTDIGTLGGRCARAYALNEKPQVVGTSQNDEGYYHAFIWDRRGGMRDIDSLNGHGSCATGINESAQVVGHAEPPDGMRGQAFYWDESSGMMYIAGPNDRRSSANGINDKGQVVGFLIEPKTKKSVAYSWTRVGGLKRMLLSSARCEAEAINNAGWIIGSIWRSKFLFFFQGKGYYFLRTRSGRIVNLNKCTGSGGAYVKATNINDDGWIVGQLEDSKGKESRPILLRPK